MKVYRIVGVTIIAVILVCLGLISAQPEKVHVEKSIVINGTPSAISKEVERFQQVEPVSPWSKVHQTYTIITFEDFGGTIYSDIKLEPEGNITKVTWIYDGYNTSLKDKAMWLFNRRDLDAQYDVGLKTLKRIVEK